MFSYWNIFWFIWDFFSFLLWWLLRYVQYSTVQLIVFCFIFCSSLYWSSYFFLFFPSILCLFCVVLYVVVSSSLRKFYHRSQRFFKNYFQDIHFFIHIISFLSFGWFCYYLRIRKISSVAFYFCFSNSFLPALCLVHVFSAHYFVSDSPHKSSILLSLPFFFFFFFFCHLPSTLSFLLFYADTLSHNIPHVSPFLHPHLFSHHSYITHCCFPHFS